MVKTTDPLDDLPTGLKLFIKNLHSRTPEKLNDSNFPSWFTTASVNLSDHRLMEYVDGTMEVPPSTLTVTVDDATGAAATTEQLHGVQKCSDSMQKYLDSVVTIVAALDRAKSGIPDQDMILFILRGLSSKYASIKQNIRTNIAHVTFAKASS
uniref:Uncharacterized protein n=1 Tax=Solanum lycopersicum TaxID=4081 RepID=A0A3Q7HBC4_SOLLC